MKNKQAKNLKHLIKFLINNSTNSLEERWSISLSTYADIKSMCIGGFETLEDLDFGHVMTKAYYIITIRYLKQLNIRLRINFNDRIFEIKRIINIDEASKFLQIIALEI